MEKSGNHSDTAGGNRHAVVAIAVLARNLIRCHRRLGITRYPRTPELSDFLRSCDRKNRRAGSRGEKRKTTPALSMPLGTGSDGSPGRLATCRSCPLAGRGREAETGKDAAESVRLMVVGDWAVWQGDGARDFLFGPREDAMLWRMMQAIGLNRSDVEVTNVLKCCPQAVPDDARIWAEHCKVHLLRQIGQIRPRIILAMGELAASVLLETGAPLFRIRGRFQSMKVQGADTIRIMATFHPRYLLEHEDLKRYAWQDLQMVQRQLERLHP